MGTPLLPTFSACVFPHIFCFLFLRSFKSDHLLLPVVSKTQPDSNVCCDFNKDNVINFLLISCFSQQERQEPHTPSAKSQPIFTY